MKKQNTAVIRIVLILAVLAMTLTGCGDAPKEPIVPYTPGIPAGTEGSPIWNCTMDDFGAYLMQTGHIGYNDYAPVGGPGTECRRYENIEVYWWDVENLKLGDMDYDNWREFEKTGFTDFKLFGMTVEWAANGPFVILTNNGYLGDREKLYADLAAFPEAYDPNAVTEMPPPDFSRDRNETVYPNFDQLAASYPNYTYEYARDPIDLPQAYCIRDDYILYTQAQGEQGMCWAFAASTALSTTLTHATGEYVDLSEAYAGAALHRAVRDGTLPNFYNAYHFDHYDYGDGSQFMAFDLIANREGVVLEQDCTNANSYLISNDNADSFFDYYSRFADRDLMKHVAAVRFDSYNNVHDRDTAMNSLKRHIMTQGSIVAWTNTGSQRYVTYNGREVGYKQPWEGGSDHVISIVGWDDSFTMEIGDETYTGAWLVLNSWGNNGEANEGIFYLFYEDASYYLGGALWGYVYRDDAQPEDLWLTDKAVSGGTYRTDKAGRYCGSFTSREGETLQKNIFYRAPVDITYSYSTSAGAEVEGIEVWYNGSNVTGDFSIQLDRDARTFRITTREPVHGEYKVIVTYSDGNGTKVHYNSIYGIDGVELGAVDLNGVEPENAGVNNGKYILSQLFGNETETVRYYTLTPAGNLSVELWFDIYSSVVDVRWDGPEGMMDGERLRNMMGGCAFYGNFPYDLSVTDTYPLTFLAADGAEKTVNFVVCPAEPGDMVANLFYDLGGGTYHGEQRVLVGEKIPYALGTPVRDGYIFGGWYYDAGFTRPVASQGEGYLVDVGSLTVYDKYSSYFQSSFEYHYGKCVYATLFARWVQA